MQKLEITSTREEEPLRVLIVDDDDTFRKVLVDLARTVGYAVQSCSDGGSAVKLIARDPFDLIITDLVMPGVDGTEVLRAARKRQPECLVIIITGHASLHTAIEAIRQGAYDYIRKPFKLEEMELALRNAGERIRLLRDNTRLLAELQRAYEQVALVREIMETSSAGTASPRSASTSFLQPHWRHSRAFIPDNRLPLASLQIERNPMNSVLEKLERLAALFNRGHLSRAEFLELKRRLLEKLETS
ncbi:MAG: response regulator [Deltaproteobacteria bacterium]|nr:response regulator [Deltaproteobacteria bacterium]MBW2071774.1 response regulator [Deltaproteobacteria bacterium]